jgi:hypothetical protein
MGPPVFAVPTGKGTDCLVITNGLWLSTPTSKAKPVSLTGQALVASTYTFQVEVVCAGRLILDEVLLVITNIYHARAGLWDILRRDANPSEPAPRTR